MRFTCKFCEIHCRLSFSSSLPNCIFEVGKGPLGPPRSHSLERPAALLNVSAVVGRVGQVELEHVAEGEVGDAPHEAALGPERSHGQVLGVDGAA